MTTPRPQAVPTMGRGRMRVLLTCEGTYPHYVGGVSTWCDLLVKGIDDVDFVVWALMMNPFIKQEYQFPPNVTQFVGVPLWGVEQPAEYTREIPTGQVFEHSRKTREADVERHFLPLFDRFIDAVTTALFDPDEFAGLLVDMHRYFRNWEYRTTWRSRPVWELFKAKLLQIPADERVIPTDGGERERLLPSREDLGDSIRYLLRGAPEEQAPAAPPEREEEYVPTVGEAIEGLHWLYRLLQTLNVEVPDCDVTHSAAAAFCAIPCILAKAERGTPFLLTEHGVYIREQYLSIERQRFPYNLKRFLIDFISAVAQTSYRMADQVSPVCAFNSRWEFAYGVSEDRLRVIYNGIDSQRMRPMSVQRPSAPTVVQVGRIDPLKDMITYLHVADRVRREIPNVQFLQWGPVSDDEYAEQVFALHRELGLQNTVRFHGRVAAELAPEKINHGDVVLMTSISEAFPYGVIDALMCGKPVVSTAVGGVPEALDGTGFTAPPKDVEALAAAVVNVLRMAPEDHAALSRAARTRALENFTLDKFIGEYRESYYDLASRPRVAREPVGELPPAAAPEPPAAARPEPAAEEPAAAPPPVPQPQRPAAPAAARPAPAEAAPGEAFGMAELAEALRSEDPFVRVRGISRAAADPGIEPMLVAALSDDYPLVRREAVRALVRTGSADVVRPLGELAARDPSVEVREEAVAALARLATGERGMEAGA